MRLLSVPLVALIFVGSAAMTLLFRRWLLARDIYDHPNQRSSHSEPIPRGGGAVFVVMICALLLAGTMTGVLSGTTFFAVAAIIGVALIGFIDDLRGVSPSVRLVIHLLCAAIAMWHPADRIAESLAVGGIGHVSILAMLTIGGAWFVNMFNFMDGIDGIASMEGAFVLIAAGAMSAADGAEGAQPWCMTAAGGAVAGFLLVNVSPRRVFMGDSGSGSLGLIVAWFLVESATSGATDAWAMSILPSCFLADACCTLAIRLARRKSPTAAHRTHAYQLLAQGGLSHHRVTVTYAVVNTCVVLPLAWGVQADRLPGPLTFIVMVTVFAAVVVAIGAGREVRHMAADKGSLSHVHQRLGPKRTP